MQGERCWVDTDTVRIKQRPRDRPKKLETKRRTANSVSQRFRNYHRQSNNAATIRCSRYCRLSKTAMKDANDTEGRARKAPGGQVAASPQAVRGSDPSISVAASEAFALGVTGTGSYSSSKVCGSKAQDYSTAWGTSCTVSCCGIHNAFFSSRSAYVCGCSGRPHNSSTVCTDADGSCSEAGG